VPKNEDGDFELILGNKQLLGIFFVVIALFGVFFVLGYLVGRNSTPMVSNEFSSARKADGKPMVMDSPAPKETPAPVTETPAPAPSKPLETAVEKPAEPKPEPPKPEPTKPSTSKSEPAISKREAKVEKEKAEKEKAEKEKAEKEKERARPPASSGPVSSAAPAAGQTYLQLVATTKHDADGTVEVLRKNGFQAIDAEVPEKPGLFRVLVGPLAPGDLNKTRAELTAKSFPGDHAIPKKF
jgi:outer membrane biosynthesis protein TonB